MEPWPRPGGDHPLPDGGQQPGHRPGGRPPGRGGNAALRPRRPDTPMGVHFRPVTSAREENVRSALPETDILIVAAAAADCRPAQAAQHRRKKVAGS